MRGWLLVLAACGGGSSGSFDATIDNNGASSTFADSCKLTESTDYLDIFSGDDKLAFEIKWRKAAITTAGTYTSTGIVSDIVLFALHPIPDSTEPKLSTATGMVTFTTYNAPSDIAGTFMLSVPNAAFTASGSFVCN